MNWRRLKRLSPLLALAVFLFALWALDRALGEYRFGDILRQLRDFPPWSIVRAAALTVITYLVLTLYDRLALRYIGRTLPAGRIMLASYTSYAFSRNIGLSLLTGGSVRYRLYSSLGLSAADVARLTAFTAFSFSLGLAAMAGGLLLFSPATLQELPRFPTSLLRPVGGLALAAVAGYLLLTFRRRRPFRWRGWQFSLPPPRLAILQVLVGATDWTLTATILYLLLPPSAGVSLPQFLQVYLVAQLAVMMSHVPGGLGVFESVILLLMPGLSAPVLFGSLLVYRALYFLFPFGTAILLLGTFETLHRHGVIRRAGAALGQWLSAAAPTLLAAAILFAGALLLFSGGTPPSPGRFRLLHERLPLPLVEAANFGAALIAAGLLLIAPALQRRLRAAHLTALVLLAAGAALALLKGLQVGTAAFLGLVLAAETSARGHFDQQGAILEEPPSPGWLAAMLIAFSGSVWLGFFAFRPPDVTPQTGLIFTVSDHFSRFLRGETGAALLLLAALLAGRRRTERPRLAGPREKQQAGQILARYGSPLGPRLLDRQLLFSGGGEAFLAYRTAPRCRIALGDPVGPKPQRRELARRFQRLCERGGEWPVFHMVGEGELSVHLDLGLTLQTIGERGSIDLAAGPIRNGRVRPIWRMEIVPDVGAAAPLLACGEFPPGTPAAVLRRGREVVGIATFWADHARRELVPLLLRNTPEGGKEILRELLLSLADWGQGEGFLSLDLGLTPPAAGNSSLDPLLPSLETGLYTHGEHFASLAELRRFKETFHPRWEPRYLACPDGIDLPEILKEIAGP